jgi:hypothetical protein
MAGIADRLLGLGRSRAKHATRDLPDLGAPLSSLPPEDRGALERAKRAAARCQAQLRDDDAIPPGVVVELGGAVEGMMEQVQQLADRLVKARAWLRRHQPEALARQAAMAELDEQVGGAPAGRAGSSQALAEQARLAAEVEQGIPKLSFRLGTAARELEALEGRLVSPAAHDAAAALSEGIERQRDRAAQALEDWEATARELRGL